VVEEQVVLMEDGKTMAELARGHGGVLGQLGEGRAAFAEQCRKYSLRTVVSLGETQRTRDTTSSVERGTYGGEFAMQLVNEQSAQLCDRLRLEHMSVWLSLDSAAGGVARHATGGRGGDVPPT
jgi:hypothetical protein